MVSMSSFRTTIPLCSARSPLPRGSKRRAHRSMAAAHYNLKSRDEAISPREPAQLTLPIWVQVGIWFVEDREVSAETG